MPALQVTTLTGASTAVDASLVEALRAALQGELLLASDANYATARRIWNRNVDKHPALIARCQGVADVLQAVAFARTHELLVSIRGGGHS